MNRIYEEPYSLQSYYVRQKLEGRSARREKKGRPVPAEEALWLSVLRIVPDNPICTVQIFHDLGDRKERYIPFLHYMASRNIAVILHDLRGHGNSLLPEGPAFCGEEALDRLHTDADAVYASLFAPVPESGKMEIGFADFPQTDPLPRFLLGVGMGALIAGSYAGDNDDRLAGLLLAGLPRREPAVSCSLGFTELLSLFGGESWRHGLLQRSRIRRYNRPFRQMGEEGDFLWLSESRENREAFMADPLCGCPLTVSACRFLLTLLRDLYRPASWNVLQRDLPIWLFSGENDPVAGGERHVLNTETFLRDIGYKNIENRLFPRCRHEILMDTYREAIWQETADCILDACEKSVRVQPETQTTE